jgi:hypothetical protein
MVKRVVECMGYVLGVVTCSVDTKTRVEIKIASVLTRFTTFGRIKTVLSK